MGLGQWWGYKNWCLDALEGLFALNLIGSQGVVTYMSPVEAFATAIKQQKVCLIASFSRVKGQIAAARS